MHTIRHPWRAAAGLLLAVAAGPVAAQEAPALPPARADIPGTVKTLPPPRPAAAPPAVDAAPPASSALPAPAAAGPGCAPAATGRTWLQWRDGHHAGCQAKMWGYPEEFEAPPLGASIHAHYTAMVANGDAAAMVLYRYDFLNGSDVLNTHGYDRLARMAARQADNHFPIVIERTPEAPGLAEARRATVLSVMASNGAPVPPDLVVVGPRRAVGLPGADAVRIYGFHVINMAVQSQPVPLLSSGGTSAATGGGGGAFGPTGGGR